MRAFQLLGRGRAELREVPLPEPASGEVRLAVAGAGVCHSDLHLLHAPAVPYDLPMTLGHEVSGHVDACGPDVSGWHAGDAAVVHLCWSCGVCRACTSGRDNYCAAHPRSSVPGPGMGHHGGMADHVVVPARHLRPAHGLDLVDAAPLADAGLTPFHAVATARDVLTPGSTAVVVGVGGLGNLAVQVLRTTPAAQVVAVDRHEGRLAEARRRGATHVLTADDGTGDAVRTLTAGVGADLVVDVVGSQDTLDLAAACIAPGGRIVVLGLGAGRLRVLAGPPPYGLPWGVSVTRTYAGAQEELDRVLDLAREGRVQVPVQRFPLADAADVLGRLEAGEIVGRAVLVP